MVRVAHMVTLNRPTTEVFTALTDFANSPRWQPEVIEERSSPAGPVRVGTQIFQARTFRGKRIESTSQVVECEPGRKLVNVSLPHVTPALRTEYDLKPLDNDKDTELTFVIELKGSGFFRLLEPVIQRSLQKDVVSRFEQLKDLLRT